MSKNNIITAIDLGSHSIKAIAIQKRKEGEGFSVLSSNTTISDGIKRGVIMDSDIVTEKINQTFIKLKAQTRPQKISEVFVNIGGPHVVSRNGHGAVAISRADQKVSKEDVQRVLDEAKAINLTDNQEIFDVFPKEFIVDQETGSKDVIGMKGIKLEVEALDLCVLSIHLEKVVSSVLNADLKIGEIVPSPIAASDVLLSPQQKELGVAVIDIGAETTGIAVYEEKNLIHVAILPVGSAHITRDIAIALQADIEIAEKIKKELGGLIFTTTSKKQKIKLDNDEIFEFDTKGLVKAGKARVKEIFDLIEEELKSIKKQDALVAGIILTGGGSKLKGIVDFAKKELKLSVKIGTPINFIGCEDDPSMSVVCGLAQRGLMESINGPDSGPGFSIKKMWSFIKKILNIFVP